MEGMTKEEEKLSEKHYLLDKWVMWAHLPSNSNWDLKSYKKIVTLDNIEDATYFYENISDNITKNYMLFLMREGINPLWEDPRNIKGGCFSYKTNNKNINESWKNLSYLLLGETLTSPKLSKHINGITISPKKNFFIIKIWLDTCDYYDPEIITDIKDISKIGCFFKKHISE